METITETTEKKKTTEKKETRGATGTSAQQGTPAPSWTLPGMCFNTSAPNQPKPTQISFPCGQNINMPGTKVHSGQAVDADVAAFFINNFYTYYTLTVNQDPDKTKPVSPATEPESIEAQFNSLKQQHDLLKTHHGKVKSINESLVKMTYGMTLDKDLLLNVLGQQCCEGIRFYLCGRQVEDKTMHLSLVAVGVDKDGFDLNYNKPSDQPVKDLMAGLKSIPTQSVTLEYTTPPPPNGVNVGNNNDETAAAEDIDEHFALLKLARANQLPNNTIDPSFVLV